MTEVGVVAGVVAVVGALIWYLRRRRQDTSQRGIISFLRSRLRSGVNANAPPAGAQTQELPGSHYYAPSGIPSQMFYNSSSTSRTFAPQPSPNIPVTGPNLSGAPHTSTKSNYAPSTNRSAYATTTPSDISSDPDAHRGSGVYAPAMPPASAQGPATAGPPSHSYNVAVNHVQGPVPNDPVEEGLMSGRRRGRYP